MQTFVQALDPLELFLLLAVTGISAACLFVRSFYYLKKSRLITDTPLSRVRSAAQGYLKLKGIGKALPENPVIAPHSGKPCLWYRYTVVQLNQPSFEFNWPGKSSAQTTQSKEYFFLEDESEGCLIDPEFAVIYPTVKLEWYGETRSCKAPLLSEKLISFKGQANYKFIEERIEINMPLYVQGRYHTLGHDDESRSIDDEVGDLIILWKQDYDELLRRYDTNGDGQLCMQEWQAVMNAAAKEIKAQRSTATTTTKVDIVQKGSRCPKPLIISGVPPEDISRSLRLVALLYLSTSIVCGMFTAAIIHAMQST